jgi:hypothetical protein
VSARFTAPEVVMLAVHWLCLWLGFHLLGRRPRSRATVLAGLAYVALAGYVLNALVLVAPERVPVNILWGIVLGGLVPFAPALLLHAYLSLTGVRLPRQGLVLGLVYAGAVAVYLLGFTDTLLYTYQSAPAAPSVRALSTTTPWGPTSVWTSNPARRRRLPNISARFPGPSPDDRGGRDDRPDTTPFNSPSSCDNPSS